MNNAQSLFELSSSDMFYQFNKIELEKRALILERKYCNALYWKNKYCGICARDCEGVNCFLNLPNYRYNLEGKIIPVFPYFNLYELLNLGKIKFNPFVYSSVPHSICNTLHTKPLYGYLMKFKFIHNVDFNQFAMINLNLTFKFQHFINECMQFLRERRCTSFNTSNAIIEQLGDLVYTGFTESSYIFRTEKPFLLQNCHNVRFIYENGVTKIERSIYFYISCSDLLWANVLNLIICEFDNRLRHNFHDFINETIHRLIRNRKNAKILKLFFNYSLFLQNNLVY